jgi:hypothetical protein
MLAGLAWLSLSRGTIAVSSLPLLLLLIGDDLAAEVFFQAMILHSWSMLELTWIKSTRAI